MQATELAAPNTLRAEIPEFGRAPFCNKCKRQVDSFSWERYFDEIPNKIGLMEFVPNGAGHVEISCHGETWQAERNRFGTWHESGVNPKSTWVGAI